MGQRQRVRVGNEGVISFMDQGEGMPVVLLHGIPGSSTSWAPVATRLAQRHRVLVPDLIGFGESSRRSNADELHARRQAEALLEALDKLGVASFTLVGHDFGGPVALMLLARAPERVTGLGLLSTNAFTDTPIPFPLSVTTWPWVGGVAEKLLFSSASLRMMLRQGVGKPRILIDPGTSIGDSAQARAIATIFAASLRRLAELYGPIQQALKRVHIPTFVAWGDRDPFFSVEHGRRTAAAIAGARFELLEGAGHFLPEERPEEVASLISALAGGQVPLRRGA